MFFFLCLFVFVAIQHITGLVFLTLMKIFQRKRRSPVKTDDSDVRYVNGSALFLLKLKKKQQGNKLKITF